MDGMPGMRRALGAGKKYSVTPIKKMVGPLAPTQYHYASSVPVRHVTLLVLLSFLAGFALAIFFPELIEYFSSVVRSAQLESKVVNVSQIPALEGLTGLRSGR